MQRYNLHDKKNVTYKNIIPQHQKYVTYIQRYKLSTPKICYAYTQLQTFNLRIVLNILKKSLIYHFACYAYSGDGEHRFRFYREHLNSTHWVHDIFNLSVHDGQF